MPKDHLSISPLLDPLDHLVTPPPVVMVSGQPALRLISKEILLDVILIGRSNPRPGFFEIELHNRQTWCVTGRMMQGYPLGEFEALTAEGRPVLVEG